MKSSARSWNLISRHLPAIPQEIKRLGTLLGVLESTEFPFPFGNISNVAIAASTAAIPNVDISGINGIDETQDLQPGYTLVASSPSVVPFVPQIDLQVSFEWIQNVQVKQIAP